MQDACNGIDAGMMVVLGLSDESVESICLDARESGKRVWAANYNQDSQIVVAGIKSDLSILEQTFKDAGAKRAMLLNMSVASHCPLLDSAKLPLESLMVSMLNEKFDAPIVSNVTAMAYNTKDEALKLLTKQLVESVKYKQSIEFAMNECDVFVEFGNGSVLKGLNKKIAPNKETLNISDMASLKEVVQAVC